MPNSNKNTRVASYNVRKAVGLDRLRRPGRTLDVINSLEADIVVLQEADKRLGPRKSVFCRQDIEKFTDFHVVEVARNDVSLGWHGNAILARKGISVSKVQRIDLPGFEPRGAVLAQLEHDESTLRVVATHLGLTRQMRRAQLAKITDHVEKMPLIPTVILGDFNEWRNERGLEPLQNNYQVHAPGRSFHAARPIASLDRIAVDQSLAMINAGVKESTLSQRASDHLPVWADLVAA